MAALPVVPYFAAGLAAAVGQLTTALRLPNGWVASPSLRWTPSGATLLVWWGPAPNRAPGGGEKRKTRRSAAQQRRLGCCSSEQHHYFHLLPPTLPPLALRKAAPSMPTMRCAPFLQMSIALTRAAGAPAREWAARGGAALAAVRLTRSPRPATAAHVAAGHRRRSCAPSWPSCGPPWSPRRTCGAARSSTTRRLTPIRLSVPPSRSECGRSTRRLIWPRRHQDQALLE